jgi:NAD(P)-dependent dehydrogenase (short-subunit alcohol dehydrogenase family)
VKVRHIGKNQRIKNKGLFMKIIVVGATGTIGQAVVKELSKRHTVIPVSHKHGDIRVDIKEPGSIEHMYREIGDFDALVSTIGKVHFADLATMTADDYYIGIHDKLMGQINLVLLGAPNINRGGSFTLTSGILSHDPIRSGSSASMVNGALDGFVRGAAIEMPREIRINVVSPTVVTESLPSYGEYFHGFESVGADRVAMAFSKSVEGKQTGQVYKVGY